MSMYSSHIKLYTGSFTEIQRLKLDLHDAEIQFIVKNNCRARRKAKLAALNDRIELSIFTRDTAEASEILNKIKAELN